MQNKHVRKIILRSNSSNSSPFCLPVKYRAFIFAEAQDLTHCIAHGVSVLSPSSPISYLYGQDLQTLPKTSSFKIWYGDRTSKQETVQAEQETPLHFMKESLD